MTLLEFFTGFITVFENPLWDWLFGGLLVTISGSIAYAIGGYLGYSGKSFDPYQAALDNRVSNPYGRHGGPTHSGLVESLRMLFNELGLDVSPRERRVPIPGTDKYRYPDLIVDTGYETVYVQVGKSTSTGNPIAREQRAMDDLLKTGNQVWFFCYDD